MNSTLFYRALLFLFFILYNFSFLSWSYPIYLEVHTMHCHAVAESWLQGYIFESVILVYGRFEQTTCVIGALSVYEIIEWRAYFFLKNTGYPCWWYAQFVGKCFPWEMNVTEDMIVAYHRFNPCGKFLMIIHLMHSKHSFLSCRRCCWPRCWYDMMYRCLGCWVWLQT